MPPVPPTAPRRKRRQLIVAALAAVVALGLLATRLERRSPAPLAPAPQPQTRAVSPTSGGVPAVGPVAPGTAVSAEEVLGRLGGWIAAHPNCQSVIETSVFGGGTISKLEIFAYTNALAEPTVKIKADIFLPQALQLEAQNDKGRLRVYFPRSGRLVEPDLSGAMLSLPAYAADQSSMTALLKLARTTFAEASADLRVATLALDAQALRLPFMSGDIYLSFRTDLDGKLLGIEEQAQATRIISTVRYVTFDREQIMRRAPSLPLDKVAVLGKTLQQAMEEEGRLIMNKPLTGTRI